MPRPMPKAHAAEFYRRLAALNPEPQGELNFVNPYTLLVAVALSAQATDISVNKATERLFQDVKTPQAMVALGEEGLKEHIKTIGLYNSKAKNVIKLSEILLSEHGGEVPDDQAALEKLPGVGRKTATRQVLQMTKWNDSALESFSKAVSELAELRRCVDCGFFSENTFA